MARLTRPLFLLPLCILLGWVSDLLFWDRPWGVSFPLFVALALALGLCQAARLGRRPAAGSWPLAALALAFAAASGLRAEPFTLFITRSFSLLFLMLFAAGFLGGDWLNYRFSDFAVKLLGLVPSGLLASRELKPAGKRRAPAGRLLPVLRGLLLALPVLALLASLLASADAYFAEWLDELLSFIQLERLPEYILRFSLILVIAYALFGSFLYAFFRSAPSKAAQKPLLKPFIGFTEAVTVLASVALLLATFVAIQFRYFFGGVGNVLVPSGFTYAEYARRGFAELCLVAVIILMLFIALSALAHRKPAQQKYFSGLGVVLLALVSVILISAFQRLLLYEQAYGFTRMRTVPHVFMIWLGLLLLALVVLELAGRQRHFAAAVLLAATGFAATFPLLNMDAFIARANIQHGLIRMQAERGFDGGYLSELSTDAVPALAESYQSLHAEGNTHLALQVVVTLTCNALVHEDFAPQAWPSWTLSAQRAREAWQALQAQPRFPKLDAATMDSGSSYVTVEGEKFLCESAVWD